MTEHKLTYRGFEVPDEIRLNGDFEPFQAGVDVVLDSKPEAGVDVDYCKADLRLTMELYPKVSILDTWPPKPEGNPAQDWRGLNHEYRYFVYNDFPVLYRAKAGGGPDAPADRMDTESAGWLPDSYTFVSLHSEFRGDYTEVSQAQGQEIEAAILKGRA